MSTAFIGVLINTIVVLGFVVRVMTRPHRDPASRIAWIAVIASVPALGIIAYILLGETSIGSRRLARMKSVIEDMPDLPGVTEPSKEGSNGDIPGQYRHLFQTGESINGFPVTVGNTGELLPDSNATIDAMVRDIDAAREHVHLMFYIWLPDGNGVKVVEALKRAAQRGIQCRAMADDLGSKDMIRSRHWREMREAGVKVACALKIGNPLLRPLRGRLDLRNHRKLLVVDNQIAYCGSQNCADPEFLVKARYAPWVDAMIRFRGPIVRQSQFLFASDWMSYFDETIDDLLQAPMPEPEPGFPAQVQGTGPTARFSAMPEMFETLFHAARRELIITTPYFVPNSSMHSALCAAAWRGVETTLVVPARNDSWIVAAASRSFYNDLLESGVRLYEYEGGLLHAKTLTIDGDVTLAGSANMDRRSFDLNYENNVLFYDPQLTADIRQRQQEYIKRSNLVTLDKVKAWRLYQRLWNNTLATLGPIL